jgi:hypothetical protein
MAESGLGTFFATVVLLGIGGMAVFTGIDLFGKRAARPPRPSEAIAWGVTVAGWLAFDLPYNLRLWGRVALGRHPAPLTAALDSVKRPSPLPLRVIAGLWWLAHTGVAFMLVLVAEQMRPHELGSGSEGGVAGFATSVLLFFMAFMYAYVMHGFLLMGIAALTRSRVAIARTWALRLPIDAAIALVAIAIPRIGPTA